jgi:hypothetical protein
MSDSLLVGISVTFPSSCIIFKGNTRRTPSMSIKSTNAVGLSDVARSVFSMSNSSHRKDRYIVQPDCSSGNSVPGMPCSRILELPVLIREKDWKEMVTG